MVSNSRPIDPHPVLSILLEPRSLVVTTDDLYRSHLHGIDNITIDDFLPHGNHLNGDEAGECPANRISIANWALLGNSEISNTLRGGGSLKRSMRTSLTCRVVDRVIGSRILGPTKATIPYLVA
jgi:alkylated DNA repair protein alkB homolog 6